MKKTHTIASLMALSLMLSACGTQPMAEKAAEQAIKEQVGDFVDGAQGLKELADLGQAVDSGNPEDTKKAMEGIAKFGMEQELKDFEKTEAVDVSSELPTSLIYSAGKVTSASDSSDETYFNIQAEIKTTDEFAKIKEFYKAALAADGWKLKSQNASSANRIEMRGEKGNLEAGVSISKDEYSAITEIDINYQGSKATE